jgi:hypothetical protein
MKRILSLSLVILFARTTFSQECTAEWRAFLDTNPLHKKVISGDSSAAYAIYAYWGDPNLKLELKGNFPKARFISFETEETRFPKSEDAIFDVDIEPDAGSENPFRNGTALDTPHRAYTVIASPQKNEGSVNTVRLPGGRLINALMFRIYAPNAGITITRGSPARISRECARATRARINRLLARGPRRDRYDGTSRRCSRIFTRRRIRSSFPIRDRNRSSA